MLKKLPIGIQTFEKIIDGNYLYIDKTDLALNLIDNYQYIFLSRPRRFGKSLFLDTLHNIFEGKKELFRGLDIYDKYEFDSYPVIKISWGGDTFGSLESMEIAAKDQLHYNQKRLDVVCDNSLPSHLCLKNLIIKSYEKYQKPVVVLIDEYDKPILNNISDIKTANLMRDFLRAFYSQLKENDAYIRFAFLTGITKFSRASIFSGLNNIEDISLNPNFATICGYTQNDIETTFKEYLVGRDKERVKTWYNGYNFLGDRVYNPFDILKFIKNGFIFRNYWWESGSPYSLMELIKTKDYYLPSLQNLKTDETLLNSFDIERIQLESLLFQAGYLTIDSVMEYPFGGSQYTLKVPNMEVQISLNNLMLNYLSDSTFQDNKLPTYNALLEAELEEFKETLMSLFASIPYNNYVKNSISNFEGYYASVVYAYLASLGVEIVAEDVTNRGRIDITLLIRDKIYIIEFKVGEQNALQQIRDKNYHQKYLKQNKQIYLVGISFDEEERNISSFEYEKVI
jgi:hypothetical protein